MAKHREFKAEVVRVQPIPQIVTEFGLAHNPLRCNVEISIIVLG